MCALYGGECMKETLKTYQIELTVKGPVYIGSGNEIYKKEYLFLNKSKIGVVDIEKLYLLVRKKHLERDFEKFMSEDTREDLKHWMIRNKIPLTEMERCMKYTENAGDISFQKGKMQIMSCITDPYGNPYVPGSSIKGMLRTILLSEKIMKNPEQYKSDKMQMKSELTEASKRGRSILSRNIASIEENAFHVLNKTDKKSNAVNDIMSGIIISDSEPLSREDIILCQKWERHAEGGMKTLNLLRECIKPGTVIRASLTIDTTICKITKDEIMNAVKAFYEQYYENFQKIFSTMDKGKPNTVFLGGGCGFVSKTIIYPLFGKREGVFTTKDIFDKTNVPREHKHVKDPQYGVSPHILKCTQYKGKEYMMGHCEITIR